MDDDKLPQIVEAAKGTSGLGNGLIALILNATEVAFVTLCFAFVMFYEMPREHDRAVETREKDREAVRQTGDTIKAAITLAIEAARLEAAAQRERDETRLGKLWERQSKVKDAVIEVKAAIADLTTELRVYHKRIPERSLPKSAPKKMAD